MPACFNASKLLKLLLCEVLGDKRPHLEWEVGRAAFYG